MWPFKARRKATQPLYQFQPRPDITVQELACVVHTLAKHIVVDEEGMKTMPVQMRRHFTDRT